MGSLRNSAARLALVCLVLACHRTPLPPADLVARLGEEEVRYPQFERYVSSNVGESAPSLGGDVLSRLFDQFLDEELLRRLAVSKQIISTEAPPRQAVDALLRQIASTTANAAEVQNYYDEHRADFTLPERVRLRQILVDDRATADRVAHEIAGGMPFADAARRFSRDPTAQRGGDQGELGRDDLPPAFSDIVFQLQPGSVSPVVSVEYGFLLFQVVERHAPGELPLASAAPRIRERLRQRSTDEALAALVQEARSRYSVVVYARNLPFRYQGSYPLRENG